MKCSDEFNVAIYTVAIQLAFKLFYFLMSKIICLIIKAQYRNALSVRIAHYLCQTFD